MTEYETVILEASSLSNTSKIRKLNGPNDWVGWNRNLERHLGKVDSWQILIGELPAPAEGTPEHNIWLKYQNRLKSLLFLICGPSALALMKTHYTGKIATEQYKVLKGMYRTTGTRILPTCYSLQPLSIMRLQQYKHTQELPLFSQQKISDDDGSRTIHSSGDEVR